MCGQGPEQVQVVPANEVVRSRPHEDQQDAHQARKEKYCEVYAGQDFLRNLVQVVGAENGQAKEKPTQHFGRKGESSVAPGMFVALEKGRFLAHQAGVGATAVKPFFQVIGKEHGLSICHGPVQFTPQQDIDAQFAPGHFIHIEVVVDMITETPGLIANYIPGLIGLSLLCKNKVAQAGGTIVEQEIILIAAILRPDIVEQKFLHGRLLFTVQFQYLLNHTAVFPLVGIEEIGECFLVEVVKQFTPYEFCVKLRVIKIKDPIVVHDVRSGGRVNDAERAVPES